MKTILITTLLLLLSSCGQGKRPSAPDLEDCLEGHEPTCAQLLPEEEPVIDEPIVEPLIEEQWTPSLSGQGDIGYSNMLYVDAFSLFLYNFKNTGVINDRFEVVFKSTNIRIMPNGDMRYAKAYFKDGYKMRFESINADDDTVKSKKKYNWTLHNDWNLTINNNDIGTQLKTEDQALQGASKWSHDIQVKDYVHCEYFLWITDCWWVYKTEGVFFKYYYE